MDIRILSAFAQTGSHLASKTPSGISPQWRPRALKPGRTFQKSKTLEAASSPVPPESVNNFPELLAHA